MLLFIIITFIVCLILYYFTLSNSFSFAAKQVQQCPAGTVNKGGKCVKQQSVQGGKKPAQSGKPNKPVSGGKPNKPGAKPVSGGKPKPNTPGKPKPGGGIGK